MVFSIDDKLTEAFTEQRLIQAFYKYKYSKWDHFSGFVNPIINIPMGADGVTFQAFENQLDRNAKNICYRVRNNKYIFYPFREVLVEKEAATPEKKAKYRTLSIASIRDALVQSILYNDVLNDTFENYFKSLDNPLPVSFAYRKGKSAPRAAQVIFSYIKEGYYHILDADLSQYFDTIPHDRLISRLEKVIGEESILTIGLINRFIHTDKVPFNSYKYATRKGVNVGYKVFYWKKPTRQKRLSGVPQGGVLSGLLANLYLHDFDTWVVDRLVKSYDIKYVRYADDFVILSKTPEQLDEINHKLQEQIEGLGLHLNQEKTELVDINQSRLIFIGFSFNQENIRVRQKNVARYKERIKKAISNPPEYITKKNNSTLTLTWLIQRVNFKVQGCFREEICPICGAKKVGAARSWIAFFQGVTDINQLKSIDKWTRTTIFKYMYQVHGVRVSRNELRKVGWKSLVNEKFRIKSSRLLPCLCDINKFGLWHFAKDLYQGKTFLSLARKRPFFVKLVDNQGVHIFVGKNEYLISKDTLIDIWDHLRNEGNIYRLELEQRGYKNTSQIVALLKGVSEIVCK